MGYCDYDTMTRIGKCLINVSYYYFYQNDDRLYNSHINFKIKCILNMSNYSTFCLFSQFNVLSSVQPPLHPCLWAWHSARSSITQLGTQAGKCGGADGTLGKHQNICHSLPFWAPNIPFFAPFFLHMDPIPALLTGKAGRPSLLASSSKSIICERFLVISKSFSNVNPSVLLPLSAQFLLEIGWLRDTQNPLVCSNSEILLCKYYEIFESRVWG